MAGERLLLVDDEDNLRSMLEAALRYEGFDVHAVGVGPRRARRRRRAVQPDLIVLDVMMPDLDGFEVCRRLRNDGVKTPVLFLTARDATDDKVRGLTLGGDDYLVKPFSLDELVAAHQRGAAPLGSGPRGCGPAVRRPRDGRRGPHRPPRGGRGPALADRVQPPAVPARQPGPGAVEAADPRPRVAVRLRRRRRRGRDLHRLPPQEGRPGRAPADPDRARRSGTRCGSSEAMSLRARLLAGMARRVVRPRRRGACIIARTTEAQPRRPGRPAAGRPRRRSCRRTARAPAVRPTPRSVRRSVYAARSPGRRALSVVSSPTSRRRGRVPRSPSTEVVGSGGTERRTFTVSSTERRRAGTASSRRASRTAR